MSKSKARIAALAAGAGILLGAAPPAAAAVIGPHADDCAPGADKPAMLVHIEGLRPHAGHVRVQAYGGDPEGYFEKGTYIARIDVDLPPSGSVEVCMPVPRPGTYAVAVKHTVGDPGSFALSNGGGFSGNPPIGALDALMRRKPAPRQVQVAVRGLTHVPVMMRYLQGAM
jgi:uncharacterized protein (DUF2141 family)